MGRGAKRDRVGGLEDDGFRECKNLIATSRRDGRPAGGVSLGISTVWEARWQRDESAQTGPKSGLPGRLAPQKLAPGLSISYDREG
jgi:hypothetical protein